MRQTGEAKVSERGQMALPAQTRHRWGLDQGGVISWIDMGDTVLLVPGGCRSCATKSWPTPTGKRRAPGSEIRTLRTSKTGSCDSPR